MSVYYRTNKTRININKDGFWIISKPNQLKSIAFTREHADFIVRASNNFWVMLDVLTRLTDHLQAQPQSEWLKETLKEAQQIISDAKKGITIEEV